MADYLSNDEITNELNKLCNQKSEREVINPIVMSYPYIGMDPFQFELLTYLIFKENKNYYFPNSNVTVLPGNKVADKGKDVTILNDKGKIIAIVQCKRYKTKISIDLIYSEMVKTILNLINDNQDTAFFTKYYFVSPLGIKAKIDDIIPIKEKYNKKEVDKYASEILKERSSLNKIDYNLEKDKVYSIVEQLEIQFLISTELDEAMIKFPSICKTFFRVESVIDLNSFKQVLDSYFTKIQSVKKQIDKQDFELKKCKNAKQFNFFFKLDAADTLNKEYLDIIAEELENVRQPARQVLAAIMHVLEKHPDKLELDPNVLLDEPNIERTKLHTRLAQLREAGFIKYYPYSETIESIDIGTGQMDSRLYKKENFFSAILQYCKNFHIDYKRVFVEKDFTVFDG